MDKTTLILVMVGLLVLFIVLVSIYIWIGYTKEEVHVDTEVAITFLGMRTLIYSKHTSNAQLNDAADTIIRHYSHIKDFRVYASLLEALCVHPNADSNVILRFQRGLITANPNLKGQIEKALKLGLAGRK